jgi:hypothetical protein
VDVPVERCARATSCSCARRARAGGRRGGERRERGRRVACSPASRSP